MRKTIINLLILVLTSNMLYGQNTALHSLGTYIWNASDLPRTFNNTFRLSFVSADQGFPNYGTVLAGGGYYQDQDGSAFQLYIPYSDIYGGKAPKIRMGLYDNGSWTSWQTFFTSANANSIEADWKAKNLHVNGNVGIGTDIPTEKLAVNGNIRAKEIKVEATNWPDYVFKPDYTLMPLKEVEQHIKTHGHLPDIPKAEQIEQDGLSVGEMNKLMMKKIEELTLHLIEKDRNLESLNKQVVDLRDELNSIRQMIK